MQGGDYGKEVTVLQSEQNGEKELQQELKRAENRERIAQCKLEHLKVRFDKLYNELAVCQDRLDAQQADNRELNEKLVVTQSECSRAVEEALMWRTQLFERMELLETTQRELQDREQELEMARKQVDQAALHHRINHEELQKRDRERVAFEIKISEIQKTEHQARQQVDDVLAALTDAEAAIASLQRSSDLYQREADSLKSIGASLAEKLNRASEQNRLFSEKLTAVEDELASERERSGQLTDEVDRLKSELFEAKRQIVTLELQNNAQELQKTGDSKAAFTNKEKYAEFPAAESRVRRSGGRSILSRATKTMSGWFRLDDSDHGVGMSNN